VLYFLECITRQTAFGRILIENVNERIEQKAFSGQPKIRSGRGAAGKGAGPESARNPRKSNTNRELSERPDGRTKEPPGLASGEAGRRKTRLEASAQEGRHGMDMRYKEGAAKQHATGKEASKAAPKPPQEQLNTSSLKRLTVPGYEGESFKNLVKVYMFLVSFRADLGLGEFSLGSLGEAVREPDYASKLIFGIHSALVGVVDADVKARKERYHESIAFIIERLPAFATDSSVPAIKRRAAMTPENWKAQTKLFIQSLRKDADEDRILQFCTFFRKDAFALRLQLLAFLIDIATLTERFRDIVAAKQADYRAAKAKHDELVLLRKKKADEGQQKIEELTEELKDCSRTMAGHPLRVHMGSYQAYTTFIMDGKPFLKHSNDFYHLGKKDVSLILCDLRSHSKTDKYLASNLKACAEALL